MQDYIASIKNNSRMKKSSKPIDKPIDKLEELLSKWEEPVSMRDRPKNLTLLMIREMQRIYLRLRNGEKAYFLLSDLVPYLEKCGINVDSDGANYGLNYIASVLPSVRNVPADNATAVRIATSRAK